MLPVSQPGAARGALPGSHEEWDWLHCWALPLRFPQVVLRCPTWGKLWVCMAVRWLWGG